MNRKRKNKQSISNAGNWLLAAIHNWIVLPANSISTNPQIWQEQFFLATPCVFVIVGTPLKMNQAQSAWQWIELPFSIWSKTITSTPNHIVNKAGAQVIVVVVAAKMQRTKNWKRKIGSSRQCYYTRANVTVLQVAAF